MVPDSLPASPRLESLLRDFTAGDSSALEAFWQEISEHGTPLIETVEDAGHFLVTFLWRADNVHQQVAIVSALPGRDSTEEMARLTGTDLFYKTYRVRIDTRESYQFHIAGKNVTDPHNSRTHVFPDDPETGFTGWTSSFFELPDAPPQQWTTPRVGVPQGKTTLYRLPSDILEHEYRVWVYTPPDYHPEGGPYGYLLVLDGWFYVNLIPTPTILDNLIAEGRLPPLVAILVGGVFDGVRQRDLACHPPFMDFLTQELLPWAQQNYHLTEDPRQALVAGASLGGLMAAYIGLHHSKIFGNVLAQSAFFGWKPGDEEEDQWIARQYIGSPLLPLRFYIEVGNLETDVQTSEPSWNNFLLAARYMRDVLRAKGYHAHYTEFG